MASDTRAAGFYGKLPTLGDFVGRRLGRDFVAPWDEWLQRAMSISRKRLGGGWLDAYLTSPLWRFVLASGVCGEDAHAGVLMPSCDRVGRYFPLAVVATLPAREGLFRLAQAANEWFEEAENVLCSTLDEDAEFDLQHFDARVLALGLPGEPTPVARVVDEFGDGVSLLLALGSGQTLGTAFAGMAEQLAGSAMGRCSLWWTAGSEQMAPALRLCRGLPSPEVYAHMLSGGADTASGAVPVTSGGMPAIEDAVFDEAAEDAASGGAVLDDETGMPADWQAHSARESTHTAQGDAGPAATDEEAASAPDRQRAHKQSEGGLPLIEDAGLPSDDGFREDKP